MALAGARLGPSVIAALFFFRSFITDRWALPKKLEAIIRWMMASNRVPF